MAWHGRTEAPKRLAAQLVQVVDEVPLGRSKHPVDIHLDRLLATANLMSDKWIAPLRASANVHVVGLVPSDVSHKRMTHSMIPQLSTIDHES